jgi:hypothetical protein
MGRRLYPTFSLRKGKILYNFDYLTKIIFLFSVKNIVCRITSLFYPDGHFRFFSDVTFIYVVEILAKKVSAIIQEKS